MPPGLVFLENLNLDFNQQLYGRGEPYQYSIAVVRKGTLSNVQPGYGLSALRGTKACFPGVGALAGWVMPIHVVSF